MKRILSLFLALLMLLSTLAVLTSCAPKDDGAQISIYLGDEIFDLDPSDYCVSSNAEQLLSLLYEPLFRVTEKGKVKCAAAKDYEVDEDNREIIIDIKETYWSDNVQLRASDYVYAWCERIINSTTQNPAAALFYDIEGAMEVASGNGTPSDIGIKATAMQQITIKYREGADYERILTNLASVATAPVRQDIVESAPTYWANTASVSNTIITNGPFKLKTYNKSTGELELARNLGYHQSPDKKDYDNQVNPGLLYTTFVTGDNSVSVSYEDIENKVVFIMTDAPLSMRSEYVKKADVADHTSTYTYVFNTQHPLFSDYRVRNALSAVIDRDQIADAITFGKPADGFVPDISGGSDAALISTSSDVERARAYLADVDPELLEQYKSFTLKIDSDEQSKRIAEIVVPAWESLGFDVTVEVVEPVVTEIKQVVVNSKDGGLSEEVLTTIYDSGIQYLIKDAAVGEADFDVVAVDWQMFSYDPAVGLSSLAATISGCGKEFIAGDPALGTADSSITRSNIAGWTDSAYDQLMIDIWNTCDADKRAALLKIAEEYLVNAMPVCPLIFNQSFVFEASGISHIKVDGYGHFSFTDVSLRNYKKYLKPDDED